MHRFVAQLVQGFAVTGDLPHDVPTFLRMHDRGNLVEHIARVASWGERIAHAVGADSRAAVTAGWLHDVSLVLPYDAMPQAAREAGLDSLAEERQVPALLHGKLSAALAEQWLRAACQEYGLTQ